MANNNGRKRLQNDITGQRIDHDVSCITLCSTDDDVSSISPPGSVPDMSYFAKRSKTSSFNTTPNYIELSSETDPGSPPDMRQVVMDEIEMPTSPVMQVQDEVVGLRESTGSSIAPGQPKATNSSGGSTLPDLTLTRTSSLLAPAEDGSVFVVSDASNSSSSTENSHQYTSTTFDAAFERTGILNGAAARKRGRPSKVGICRDANNNIIPEEVVLDEEDIEQGFETVTVHMAHSSLKKLITSSTTKSFSDGNIRERGQKSLPPNSASSSRLSREHTKSDTRPNESSRSRGRKGSQETDQQSSSQEARVLRSRLSLGKPLTMPRSSSREGSGHLRLQDQKSKSVPQPRSADKETTGFKRLSLDDIKLVQLKPIVKMVRIEEHVFQHYQETWKRESEHRLDSDSGSQDLSLNTSSNSRKATSEAKSSDAVVSKKVDTPMNKKRRVEPPEIFDENTNFFSDYQEAVQADLQDTAIKSSPPDPLPVRALISIPEPASKSSDSRLSSTAREDGAKAQTSSKRPTEDENQPAAKKAKLSETVTTRASVVSKTSDKSQETPSTSKLAPKSSTENKSSASVTTKKMKKAQALTSNQQSKNSTSTPAQPVVKHTTKQSTETPKASVESFRIPKLVKKSQPSSENRLKKTATPTEAGPAATEVKSTRQEVRTSLEAAIIQAKNTKLKNPSVDRPMTRGQSSLGAANLKEKDQPNATQTGAVIPLNTDQAIESLKRRFLGRPLTLGEHNEKRKLFSRQINCAHPYFSYSYLFQDYLTEMTLAPSLDFNLLQATIPDSPGDELGVRQLSNEHQLELCRLMSRNAGMINYYRLANFGPDLRDGSAATVPPNNKQLLQQYHTITDDFKKMEFVLNNLSCMTMAEAYALYRAYNTKFASPYRQITVFHNPNFDFKPKLFGRMDIKIETENDGCVIPNLKAPVEEVVSYALHKQEESYNVSAIRAALFNNRTQTKSDQKNVEISPGGTQSNPGMTFDAKIKKAQELINDKHTFDNLYVNSVFRRNSGIKCPPMKEIAARNLTSASYFEQCRNARIQPPRVDTSDFKRFANYKAVSNENRGDMQRANKFRILTSAETQRIINELQDRDGFKNLNLFQLFDQRRRV